MNRFEFEELVRQAFESLPDQFLEKLDNVDVVVNDYPSREQRRTNNLAPDETLYGLYEGIPQPDREGYGFVMPDKITIFQRPIEEACQDDEQVVEQVRVTVVHEIAHHFGFSDEALHEMGLG